METFKLDDRVKVIGKNAKGRIAFIGKIHLTEGIMYGVALDKPKGRCSGQIGDVSYFNCSKDHGVFVRACQLKMDDEDSSDYSDNYNGDRISRRAYPNYLKFSSQMNLRKIKHHSKSKELVSKEKSLLKQNVQSKQPSDNNQCLKVNKDPKLNVQKRRHVSSKSDVKLTLDKENVQMHEIKTLTRQIDTIRRYLKKLKIYVRWSKSFDLEQNQLKTHLDTAIDSVIRNMMGIVGNSEKGNEFDHDHSKGDFGLEKENDLLLQCIWDLEKKNETLLICITNIKGLLQNSWKLRARGKSKSEVNREETSEMLCPPEKDYGNCSPKNPATQSAFNLSSKTLQHLGEILQDDSQEERNTKTVKSHHKSIKFAAETENQEASSSSLYSKKENGQHSNPKTDAHLSKVECVRNYLELINNDIKELNSKLRGIGDEKSNDKCEKEEGKRNSTMGHQKSPISKEKQLSSSFNEKVLHSLTANSKTRHKTKSHQSNVRYHPYVSYKKLNTEKNAPISENDFTEDEKYTTKELSEFISNIMPNMNLNEQNEMVPQDSVKELGEFNPNITTSMNLNEQNETVPKDSAKELSELIANITSNMIQDELNEMTPKKSSKFKELNVDRLSTSVVAGKSYSSPDSDNFEKVSTPTNKIKSEDILKSQKSVLAGKTCRSKSPKKRIYLKQTMKARKQSTLHRFDERIKQRKP